MKKMLLIVSCLILSASFALAANLASDDASNYGGGWNDGSNGGSGDPFSSEMPVPTCQRGLRPAIVPPELRGDARGARGGSGRGGLGPAARLSGSVRASSRRMAT